MRSGRSSLLRLTWHELRRRRVARVGALYAVSAWLVLQIAEITYEPLGLPDWALTWTVLAVVLGFPVALVLAWFFEISPRGLIRERGVGPAVGRVFAVLVVLSTVGGLGWWLAEVYAPQRGEAQARAATSEINTVAVLPFDDMSANGDQRHLADGIAEELLDRLAHLPGLRVAARTSSFALRDFGGGIEELGRLLRVRWVLEGSVRSAGGRVRVTAQLIDAADGFHAWSQTYERDSDDLFALQDEVTAAITEELQRRIPRLRAATPAAAAVANSADNEVEGKTLELYLRGRQAWRQRTPAALTEAEALFMEATRGDPEFARGWSGLADTYLLHANYGLRPVHEAVELAEPAAVRAITLDPGLGEAWASIGLLRWSAGQMGPAQRSLEEAMRLDPRYEMAPMWLAGVFGERGEYAEQRRVLEQAHELNPLEPVINSNLASLLASRGEVEQARAVLERVLAVTPREPLLLRTLAEIEHGQARLTRARAGTSRTQCRRGRPRQRGPVDRRVVDAGGLRGSRDPSGRAAGGPQAPGPGAGPAPASGPARAVAGIGGTGHPPARFAGPADPAGSRPAGAWRGHPPGRGRTGRGHRLAAAGDGRAHRHRGRQRLHARCRELPRRRT
jgi:TolB-like protein